MPSARLRILIGAAALLLAAVVLTHVATCRVLHASGMAHAAAGSHQPPDSDHFPDATLDGIAGAAGLLAVLGLLASRLLHHSDVVAVRFRATRAAFHGPSPPGREAHTPPASIAFNVLRC